MEKVLVVDTQALLSRAIFAFETYGYKTLSGIPTHGVYGFFKILLKEVKVFKPHYIICCNDNKMSFRKNTTSTYKEHRSSSDFRHYQSRLLSCCLAELGIPVLSVDGYEADDLIATVTRLQSSITVDGRELINPLFKILSGDRDLLQLIDTNVQMYLWKSNDAHNLISTSDQVKKEIGVYPDQVLDYKAMVGDTSDEIPGISKFGKKASEEFFNNYYSYEEGLKDNFSKLNNRAKNAINNDPEGYSKSKFLATLYNINDFKLELTKVGEVKQATILLHDLECRSLGNDLVNMSWNRVNYKMYGSKELPVYERG